MGVYVFRLFDSEEASREQGRGGYLELDARSLVPETQLPLEDWEGRGELHGEGSIAVLRKSPGNQDHNTRVGEGVPRCECQLFNGLNSLAWIGRYLWSGIWGCNLPDGWSEFRQLAALTGTLLSIECFLSLVPASSESQEFELARPAWCFTVDSHAPRNIAAASAF